MIICVVLAPAAIIVKSIPFSTRPITPSLAASATWIDSETSACMAGAVPRMAETSASRPSRFRNPIPDATHKGAYTKTLEEAATRHLICCSARAETGKRKTKDATSPNRLNFILSSFCDDGLHRNHKREKGPGRSGVSWNVFADGAERWRGFIVTHRRHRSRMKRIVLPL